MKNGRYEDWDGNVECYLNDQLHNEEGPAVEYNCGTEKWYFHGQLHNESGPAIDYKDGTFDWYIYGQELSEEKFNEWLIKKNLYEKLDFRLAAKPIQKRVKI